MSASVINEKMQVEEVELKALSGMGCMVSNILAVIACIAGCIIGIIMIEDGGNMAFGVALTVVGGLYGFIIGPVMFGGLKLLRPNEAYVLTLFGRYYGTLKGAGFYWVNPFCSAINPAADKTNLTTGTTGTSDQQAIATAITAATTAQGLSGKKRISLKAMTLSNERQKINDQLGNPIIIGTVVIWRVVNTAKAVFNVDNFKEFLSIQSDSALRDIVRLYPYDSTSDNEKTLRGSSMEVAEKLKNEIQAKVDVAGLEIIEARITQLSYSEEIAAAMLQRQQASAIVDARQMIVEGAVSMVEMALTKLNEKDIVKLDEERKAAMVSNLLVVLCGSKDAQPIVNSGSIY